MYLFESAVISGIDPLNGRAPKERNNLSQQFSKTMFTETSSWFIIGRTGKEKFMLNIYVVNLGANK